jgi:hypothetical protein
VLHFPVDNAEGESLFGRETTRVSKLRWERVKEIAIPLLGNFLMGR